MPCASCGDGTDNTNINPLDTCTNSQMQCGNPCHTDPTNTAAHETVRKQVNDYIKSGVFDGYIDFDAAVSDGADPPKMQAPFAAWAQQDWLHPGPAGYQAIGDSVDLTMFTRCPVYALTWLRAERFIR